jgi:hypothetical protein
MGGCSVGPGNGSGGHGARSAGYPVAGLEAGRPRAEGPVEPVRPLADDPAVVAVTVVGGGTLTTGRGRTITAGVESVRAELVGSGRVGACPAAPRRDRC